VPSQNFIDLYNAGVIDDPLYGLNDFNYRWISSEDWIYTSTLDVAPARGSWDSYAVVLLVFEGLDTVAEITLNDNFVASTNNMFRKYELDITHHVRQSNTLSVRFSSPTKYANMTATYSENFPQTENISSVDTFVFSNREYIRKEQSSFGWDWGTCEP